MKDTATTTITVAFTADIPIGPPPDLMAVVDAYLPDVIEPELLDGFGEYILEFSNEAYEDDVDDDVDPDAPITGEGRNRIALLMVTDLVRFYESLLSKDVISKTFSLPDGYEAYMWMTANPELVEYWERVLLMSSALAPDLLKYLCVSDNPFVLTWP